MNAYPTTDNALTKQLPPVPESIGRLGQSLEAMNKAIDRLENRLEPVLGVRAPETNQTPGDPKDCRPGLAALITEHGARVARMRNRLHEIIERLEL